MTTLTKQETANSNQLAKTNSGLNIFDSGAFEQMFRVSEVLSKSSMVPDSLLRDKKGEFSDEKKVANCLLVVEQSQRWGFSPFAVVAHASVVHGKLMWEGKLVAAVVDALAGVRLSYEYTGEGENRSVTVFGTFPNEDKPRSISGTVRDWKTTGAGSPWSPANYDRQLAYRGSREWSRRHAPGVMLGIYSDDEVLESEPRNVTQIEKPKALGQRKIGKPAQASPAVEADISEEQEATILKVEKREHQGHPYSVVILDLNGEEVEANTQDESLAGLAEFNLEEEALITLEKTKAGNYKLKTLTVEGGIC